MIWEVKYLPEAIKDFQVLDGSQKKLVRKAIEKVSKNPLPYDDGGYGKPLGNMNNNELSGFLKIKLRQSGLRIVYQVIKKDDSMLVIIIGAREDDQVYQIAQKELNNMHYKNKDEFFHLCFYNSL